MEEWSHPMGLAGIPYIATGHRLIMMNRARVTNLENRLNTNLIDETNSRVSWWEGKKQQWNRFAENCPTLEQYLNAKFYHESPVCPVAAAHIALESASSPPATVQIDTDSNKSYISYIKS
jgi:hypothetical protein